MTAPQDTTNTTTAPNHLVPIWESDFQEKMKRILIKENSFSYLAADEILEIAKDLAIEKAREFDPILSKPCTWFTNYILPSAIRDYYRDRKKQDTILLDLRGRITDEVGSDLRDLRDKALREPPKLDEGDLQSLTLPPDKWDEVLLHVRNNCSRQVFAAGISHLYGMGSVSRWKSKSKFVCALSTAVFELVDLSHYDVDSLSFVAWIRFEQLEENTLGSVQDYQSIVNKRLDALIGPPNATRQLKPR